MRLPRLFTLNNELVNVWTHLLGALGFLAALIYDNTVRFPDIERRFPERGMADRLAVSFYLLCVTVPDACLSFLPSFQLFHSFFFFSP